MPEPGRLLVMTFQVPKGTEAPATPKLMMASADDVRLQTPARIGTEPAVQITAAAR